MNKKYSQRFKRFFGKKISASIQTDINNAQKLYEDYNLDSSLLSLNRFSQGQIEELPIDLQLQYHTLKGKILDTLVDFGNALTSAEKSYQIASKIEKFHDSVEKIDSYLLYAKILMKMGKYERSSEILKEIGETIKNLSDKHNKLKNEKRADCLKIQAWLNYYSGKNQENKKIYEELSKIYSDIGDLQNLAEIYSMNGWGFYVSGNMNEALKYIKKSNEIFEKIEVSPFFKNIEIRNLISYGAIAYQRGDLFEALKITNKALNLAKKINSLSFISNTLNTIGTIYFELADWDKSILYLGKALNMAEKMKQDMLVIVIILAGLIETNLNKGEIETAKEHLELIREIKNQGQNKIINQFFQISEALLLRKSKRTRDLGKSQEILKIISEGEIIFAEITIKAKINLCEMLVLEFKESKDLDVLNELNIIINKLVEIAEKQQSFLIMAEAILLKSKFALLSLNLTEARHLANQAQIICEKHGLKNLAIKVSIENDELIKNLELYERMKLENEPIEKRLEKIKIENQLNEMLHRNKFENPEIEDEDPVLLMVMTDGGVPSFTRVFKEEWNVKEQLFSGFLAAFNSFSDEIFSKGFDRAVFGEYSILMNTIENFMISYIFLGQSYLAKQKFSRITERIQNVDSIQEKLIYSRNTGLFLYPKDIPELDAQINNIFIQNESII